MLAQLMSLSQLPSSTDLQDDREQRILSPADLKPRLSPRSILSKACTPAVCCQSFVSSSLIRSPSFDFGDGRFDSSCRQQSHMAWWTTCSIEEGYTKVTQQTARQRQRGKKVELLLEECRCLCNLMVAELGKELLRGSFYTM